MITTRDLTKRFGNVEAVREVSLDVREGDRYGLLGPNGSGKSTLVRMLLGLVYATSGEISVLGHRIPNQASRALPEIGALIEEPAAYPHLSGRANLRLLDAAGPHGARRTRRRRVDDALEQVGLAGIDRRPVRAYSLGMRQRLGLAAALVRRPRLLILDEPTNGLDPRGIRDIRDLLVGLNADRRDDLPLQSSAARGLRAVHQDRRARLRPAGAAGSARVPAAADRPRPHLYRRSGTGGRDSGRPRRTPGRDGPGSPVP